MTKRLAIAVAFGLLALAPSLAQTSLAQTPAQGLEEAKALSRQAEIDFKLGRFDAARSEYSAAYEKFPTPLLLLNIGQCHRMLKAYEQAIFFYKGYLRDKPDAPNRAAIEGLIDEAEKNLEAEKAEAAGKERERQARERAPEPLPGVPASAPAAVAPGLGGQRVLALAVSGLGVAGLAIGVAVGTIALSDKSAAEAICGGATCPTQAGVNKWSSAAATGNVSSVALVIGALGVAGGAVLWFTAPKPKRAVSADVEVGPGALWLKGSF
jgi:tetratricopeptide (TPR) repeat protein